MIKLIPTKVEDVKPHWHLGYGDKPVMPSHAEITNDPFPNIVSSAKKNSGKTVTAIYLILNHFMTNKTNLYIFSGSIKTDKKNKQIIEDLMEEYPDRVKIYPRTYDKNGNDLLSEKIEETKEEFIREHKIKEKYEYPRAIFWFDDLTVEELRDPQIYQAFKTNRHSGILNILCCHNLKNIDPNTREQTNILILHKGLSKDELDNVYDWVGTGVSKQIFRTIYSKATADDGVHKNFLFIDKDKTIFRKNLGTIIDIE